MNNLNGTIYGATLGVSKAGLGEAGGDAAKFQTSATYEYMIDGIFYAQSAQSALAFSTGMDALAAGDVCLFGVWAAKTAGDIITNQGDVILAADLAAGLEALPYPPVVDDRCLVGLIRVEAGTAAFTPRTTDLGAGGITDTYYDCGVMPSKMLTA